MTHVCLKCGYDLSGEIATWEAAGACPLEGTCPECGGALRWKDIFSPEGGRLIGFVEDAYGIRRRVTWAFRTLWWALWPWKFWAKVGNYERARPLNWVWWVLAVIWLPRMLAGAGAMALFMAMEWVRVRRGGYPLRLGMRPDWLSEVLGNHVSLPYVFNGELWRGLLEYWPHSYRYLMLEVLAWPLAMIIMSDTFRRGGLRPSVLARGALFSLTPFAVLGGFEFCQSVLFVAMDLATSMGLASPSSNPGNIAVIWQFKDFAVDAIAWLGVLWVCLWWFAALSRGFKIDRAPQAWIVQVILINVILFFLFGPRIDPLSW